MLQDITTKLNESSTLITAATLGILASILKTEEHTFKSIITGVVFAGFVAYIANLGLMSYESIDDNMRTVFVGCLTYLNRYVLELLNKFGESFSEDPKKALTSIREIWKK